MLSYKSGTKIARIKGGKKDGEYIRIDYDNADDNATNEIKLQKNSFIIPVPIKGIVEKIYISGRSGSGKSYWVGRYMKQYKRRYPGNNIFLISTIDEDKELDKYDPIRLEIDEDMVYDPMQPYEFKDSLLIFDDTATIREPKIRNAVEALQDEMLEVGRHHKTHMLVTSHLLFNYMHTRRVINEATMVVLFPKSGGGTFHIKRYLREYCGLNKKQIKKYTKYPSRGMAIYRMFPMVIMGEHGVYIEEEEDDDDDE